jgi:hypothetical protein|tara:strand:- start:177 stop:377 length:201 start_codon:yes stop_codon:yes gene_type:complete
MTNQLTRELTLKEERAIYSRFSPRPTIKRVAPIKRDLPEYIITISFFTFALSMLALIASPIISIYL